MIERHPEIAEVASEIQAQLLYILQAGSTGNRREECVNVFLHPGATLLSRIVLVVEENGDDGHVVELSLFFSCVLAGQMSHLKLNIVALAVYRVLRRRYDAQCLRVPETTQAELHAIHRKHGHGLIAAVDVLIGYLV